MCGFVGEFRLPTHREQAVRQAAELLRHRGPDDAGMYHDDLLALGFQRLAIIDLSPAGHQPMSTPDGSVTVAFNGEIYNYLELRQELESSVKWKFLSHSDTEVVLAAYITWGNACFKRFNGMWAMAIRDKRNGRLVLSRDRFGEKPLYYIQRDSGYIFGSEIKALFHLLPNVPQPNDRVVFDYLVFGFHDHTTETFFSGIEQIPPAHYAVITDQGMEIKPYWTLRNQAKIDVSFDEAAERFRELLIDSIRVRLRGDVPIGTCLSGGLDSSSIALIAHKLLRSENVHLGQKTFTACSTNPHYDERQYSRLVNGMIGAEQNEVFPDPEIFRQEFHRLLWHQEEPFLSMSIFAQWEIMKRVRQRGVKVLLDGQGGDEILAGYIPIFGSLLAQQLRRGNVPGFARELWGVLTHHRRSIPHIIPTFALYVLPPSIGRWFFNRSNRIELDILEPRFRTTNFRYPDLPSPFQNQFKNHLYRLLTTTGVRALLHYEDRNSMAFSIEARVPFLDHRLAEFTLSLPDDMLMSGGETKRILRKALGEILPDQIRRRRDKFGFVVPQTEWFRHELTDDLEASFSASNLRIGKYTNPKEVRIQWQRFQTGTASLAAPLWRWYNLEKWLQRWYG